MKHLVLVPTRFVVVSSWSQGPTLRNLLDLEFVQALLPISLFGEVVYYLYGKLFPSIFTDGVVHVTLSTVLHIGYVSVQANLKILMCRLTYIFHVWFELTFYRVDKGHTLL